MQQINCEFCGKIFQRAIAEINRNKHSFCTRKCGAAFRSQSAKDKRVTRLKSELTAQELRSQLHYDANTGIFTRISAPFGSHAKVGDISGTLKQTGYMAIYVLGHQYQAHRLAWLYVHGKWPSAEIDHIDGNRANNALANLRDVSKQVNQQNRKGPSAYNKHGFFGVSKSKSRYVARIKAGGKMINLGSFSNGHDAEQCYLAAKRLMHEGNTI